MRFDIITIFPKIFDSYFSESILKRAQKKHLLEIEAHDLRQWTDDRHKTVDDRPFGGGPGMVLKVEPIYKAVRALKISNFPACAEASAGRQFPISKNPRFKTINRPAARGVV